jgi:acyl-CoA reductase-like NAD-dependent aldehyde dehydrogenase
VTVADQARPRKATDDRRYLLDSTETPGGMASQVRAGRVLINGMTDDPQAPWGGFKHSGVGREYGRYGIEAFLETRAILEP